MTAEEPAALRAVKARQHERCIGRLRCRLLRRSTASAASRRSHFCSSRHAPHASCCYDEAPPPKRFLKNLDGASCCSLSFLAASAKSIASCGRNRQNEGHQKEICQHNARSRLPPRACAGEQCVETLQQQGAQPCISSFQRIVDTERQSTTRAWFIWSIFSCIRFSFSPRSSSLSRFCAICAAAPSTSDC